MNESWHSPATVSGYDFGRCHCPGEYPDGKAPKFGQSRESGNLAGH